MCVRECLIILENRSELLLEIQQTDYKIVSPKFSHVVFGHFEDGVEPFPKGNVAVW